MKMGTNVVILTDEEEYWSGWLERTRGVPIYEGDVVTIAVKDENGNPFGDRTGKIVDIEDGIDYGDDAADLDWEQN